MLGTGYLPDMKQRWFTLACMLGDLLMRGDRCGGLAMVIVAVEEMLVIKQSMPKIHGKMEVTILRVVGDLLWASEELQQS